MNKMLRTLIAPLCLLFVMAYAMDANHSTEKKHINYVGSSEWKMEQEGGIPKLKIADTKPVISDNDMSSLSALDLVNKLERLETLYAKRLISDKHYKGTSFRIQEALKAIKFNKLYKSGQISIGDYHRTMDNTSSANRDCSDFDGWADSWGDTCESWYEPNGCGGAEYYADADGVDAYDACCVCGGGTTEEAAACADDEFDCLGDGTECIPSGWVCDIYWSDCSNGADEADCGGDEGCADGEFDCLGDGTECIPGGYVCDGSSEFCNAGWGPDCSNGADEGLDACGYADECVADPTCADTDCGYWLNYGYSCYELLGYGYDCSVCETEGVDCSAPPAGCADDEFDCLGDGTECIPSGWVCDIYWSDCSNGADEADCGGNEGCPDGYFDCLGDGTECIPGSYYCDGSSEFCNAGWGPDCSNGADEGLDTCGYADECAAGCADDEYTCNDGACIPDYWECDGWNDCSDSGDEADCGGGDPNEGLCFDDEGFNFDVDGDGYVDSESLCDYYIYYQWYFGYDCEFLAYNAVDCSDVDACGGCAAPDPCTEAGGNSGWLGDGYCDSNNNNDACGYDSGDCCPCDCVDGSWDCASYGGDCSSCTDPASSCSAGQGECEVIAGCTDPDALNYDELATEDDGSCGYTCADFDLNEDCEGNCFSDGYLSWVGDGYCDDGAYGLYFQCDAWNFDALAGDTVGDCGDAQGCDGVWNSGTEVDDCDVCGGGNADQDDCGVCYGDGCSCTATGDVNDDGDVNVADIVILVGAILGDAELTCDVGDANDDGSLNVLDAIVVVSIILGKEVVADADYAKVIITHQGARFESNGLVGFELFLQHGADFDFTLPEAAIAKGANADGTHMLVINDNNNILFNSTDEFEIVDVIAGSASGKSIAVQIIDATRFGLSNAYPNPFNPSTTVNLTVPEAGYVSVQVYNVMGQVVATLANGQMEANAYSLNWNAGSNASGLYFIKAECAGNVEVQKVMLMK